MGINREEWRKLLVRAFVSAAVSVCASLVTLHKLGVF